MVWKFENMPALSKNIPIVGIDLGTAESTAAIYHEGKIDIVLNRENQNVTPNFLSFTPDGFSVGQPAKDKIDSNPTNTFFQFKYLFGRKFDDPIVQNYIQKLDWPFKVLRDRDNMPAMLAHEALYYPEQLAARIFMYLKTCAELQLQVSSVKEAILTVPVYFGEAQLQSIKDSGKMAALTVLKTIQEPVAAVTAYNLNRADGVKKNILVFDLGAIFQVTLLTSIDEHLEVQAKSFDLDFGEANFDEAILKFCLDSFDIHFPHLNTSQEEEKVEMIRALRRLRHQIENATELLCNINSTCIHLTHFWKGRDLQVQLSQNDLERINRSNIDRCIRIIGEVLQGAELSTSQIDHVVMVGKLTRMSHIEMILLERFPGKVKKSINPKEVVAIGAAWQAALMSGTENPIIN